MGFLALVASFALSLAHTPMRAIHVRLFPVLIGIKELSACWAHFDELLFPINVDSIQERSVNEKTSSDINPVRLESTGVNPSSFRLISGFVKVLYEVDS